MHKIQTRVCCVLTRNIQWISEFFRIFLFDSAIWSLESVLNRVTVLKKLQTTHYFCEVWKVHIFIMDQGKTIFIWFKILGYFCQSHFSDDSWICLEAQKEIEMKRFYKITWNVSSLTRSCKFSEIVQINEKGQIISKGFAFTFFNKKVVWRMDRKIVFAFLHICIF